MYFETLARRMGEVTWILAGWGQINPHMWGLSNVRVFSDRLGAALVPLCGRGPVGAAECRRGTAAGHSGIDELWHSRHNRQRYGCQRGCAFGCSDQLCGGWGRRRRSLGICAAIRARGPSPAQGRSETHGNFCPLAMDLDGLRSCLRDHIREPAQRLYSGFDKFWRRALTRIVMSSNFGSIFESSPPGVTPVKRCEIGSCSTRFFEFADWHRRCSMPGVGRWASPVEPDAGCPRGQHLQPFGRLEERRQ